MVRTPGCDERTGLKKGTWTPEEDRKLVAYVTRYGTWNWRQLPKYAGLSRCGKSCRLRWMNYLRPNIKRGQYTKDEEETIIRLHESLGNRWSVIAARLPGRTDNEIKNYWHSALKKRQKRNLVANEARQISSNTSQKEEEMKSDVNPPNSETPEVVDSFNLSQQLPPSSDFSPKSANASSPDLISDDIFALLDDYLEPISNDNHLIPADPQIIKSSTLLPQPSSSDFSISTNTDVASATDLKCDDIFAFLEAYQAPGSNQIIESPKLPSQPSTRDFLCLTTDTTSTTSTDFTSDNLFTFLVATESNTNTLNPECSQITSPALHSQAQASSSDFSCMTPDTTTTTRTDFTCDDVFAFLDAFQAPESSTRSLNPETCHTINPTLHFRSCSDFSSVIITTDTATSTHSICDDKIFNS